MSVFFVPLILSKGIFFLTFVFYLNLYCIEYTFRIYILLHIRKHYFIDFCCLLLKSSKAFSVSLKEWKFVTPAASCSKDSVFTAQPFPDTHKRNELELFTKVASWWKIIIDYVIYFVTLLVYILETKSQFLVTVPKL